MVTIINKLEEHSAGHNSVWRFPAENQEVDLVQLGHLSHQYALALRELGVQRGQRVATILDNGLDLVVLLLAIWRIGAVAVPLRPRGNVQLSYRKHLQNYDDVCDLSLAIHASGFDQETLDFCQQRNKRAVCVDYFHAYRSTDSQLPKNVAVAADDLALLQFSSGSTGKPKGVMVTHGMMMAQLDNIRENHAISRGGETVASSASWLPINHDMGLFIGVLSPVHTGCDNLLAPPSFYMRNPKRWFKLLSDYNVDFTFSTNSVLASTLNNVSRLQGTDEVNLEQLHMYVAAEKVSPVIIRKCYEVLCPLGMDKSQVHIGYGMAENSLGCACTKSHYININQFVFEENGQVSVVKSHHPHAIELVAIGPPDKNHVITIRDHFNNILPELRLGEINIESPCVSPGYYNNPAATQRSLEGGRLRTGDLGFFYQGELYFYSRRDDMLVIGGRNIIPEDVEFTVEEKLSFVRVGGSFLLGIENSAKGVTELVLLVENHALRSTEEMLANRVKIQKRVYQEHDLLLNKIIICAKGTMEKTSSGKKRRKIIRDRFVNNQIDNLEMEYVSTAI